MVIGVYGIGYLAASLDPMRHWPIVLVGFLGKVFGPIGFVWCASRGEIDWRFGLTIPTNDILWWIPFALILRASWTHARHAVAAPAPCAASDCLPLGTAINLARDQRGQTLAQMSHERPVLLVALRHFGCTFCRETLAQLATDRAELESRGVRIAVLHSAAAVAACRASSCGASHCSSARSTASHVGCRGLAGFMQAVSRTADRRVWRDAPEESAGSRCRPTREI
jgi:hypothetical protein